MARFFRATFTPFSEGEIAREEAGDWNRSQETLPQAKPRGLPHASHPGFPEDIGGIAETVQRSAPDPPRRARCLGYGREPPPAAIRCLACPEGSPAGRHPGLPEKGSQDPVLPGARKSRGGRADHRRSSANFRPSSRGPNRPYALASFRTSPTSLLSRS